MVKLGVLDIERINEIVRRLDEVDLMVRNEIKAEVGKTGSDDIVSFRLASLVRCRADVQSAITALLQCRMDTEENIRNAEVEK